MKKAIVTGANGFVGRAVVKQLSEEGYKVIALVREKADRISEFVADENVEIVYCDLAEYKDLPDRICNDNYNAFFHFA